MDSILGALALGDIGEHFPDTDNEYKDIETRELDSIACNLGHESFIKEYCGKELSV